jgi:hypothetical protein
MRKGKSRWNKETYGRHCEDSKRINVVREGATKSCGLYNTKTVYTHVWLIRLTLVTPAPSGYDQKGYHDFDGG